MYARFYRPPAGSYFLFGPRGTGKSTWLRQRYPDALVIDLIDPESARFYGAAPERLRQTIVASPGRRTFVPVLGARATSCTACGRCLTRT